MKRRRRRQKSPPENGALWEDLIGVVRDATRMSLDDARITEKTIRNELHEGRLKDLISVGIESTRACVMKSAVILGLPRRPTEAECSAIAVHAILEAFSDVCPLEGLPELVRDASLRFVSLEGFTDESITEALEEATRELGAGTRVADIRTLVDEGREFFGAYIEL